MWSGQKQTSLTVGIPSDFRPHVSVEDWLSDSRISWEELSWRKENVVKPPDQDVAHFLFLKDLYEESTSGESPRD
jgi:hypothetical protein